MHANAIANGVVVSFPSKMLTHRKITPAAIKPKLAMMKSLFSIFFISFSPLSKNLTHDCLAHVPVHQIKVNVLPFQLEEVREGTQLAEAELLIEPDGAEIVASDLQIDLLKAVFHSKRKNGFHERGGGPAAPIGFSHADPELAPMAHAPRLAVQTGISDDLTVRLGKILHIVL